MTANRVALIVGIIIIIILLIWGFANLRPFLGSLFGASGKEVSINGQTFTVDVADTPEKREAGLSKKNALTEDEGMLFVFDTPGEYPFWMKDMKFPIDIIFITGDQVTTVYENVPAPENANASLPLYKPGAPADKVLEINAGLSKQYDIKPGDAVETNL
jgi:uncharacterized protein